MTDRTRSRGISGALDHVHHEVLRDADAGRPDAPRSFLQRVDDFEDAVRCDVLDVGGGIGDVQTDLEVACSSIERAPRRRADYLHFGRRRRPKDGADALVGLPGTHHLEPEHHLEEPTHAIVIDDEHDRVQTLECHDEHRTGVVSVT